MADIMILPEEYVEFITRNRGKIEAMAKGGVFDVAYGSATLNFHNGVVQNIHINKRTYQHVAGGGDTLKVVP